MSKKSNNVKVNLERVKGSLAFGYIETCELSEKVYTTWLSELGINGDVSVINAEIEFSLERDGNIAVVIIDSVLLFHGGETIDITSWIDESYLANQIENQANWDVDEFRALS